MAINQPLSKTEDESTKRTKVNKYGNGYGSSSYINVSNNTSGTTGTVVRNGHATTNGGAAVVVAEDDDAYHGDGEDDDVPYSVSIFRAYKGAREDDRSRVEEVKRSSSRTSSFYHYVIPRQWMDSFLTFISTNGTEEEKPGIIENASLFVCDTDTDDDNGKSDAEGEMSKPASSVGNVSVHAEDDLNEEENDRMRQKRREKWNRKKVDSERKPSAKGKSEQKVLRSELLHDVDYVLVGESIWFILSSKFGHDEEIQCPTVKAVNGLCVEVDDSTMIRVPPAGVWIYGSRHATFDDDNYKLSIKGEDGSPDDETSSDNDRSSWMSKTEDSPVHLLPASTSATTAGQELALVSLDESAGRRTDDLYPCPNDMEYDDGIDGDDDDDDNENVDGTCHHSRYGSPKKTNKRKRYGSGLGNLGNTCFMNSTLQCLAHTDPLRQYFISGEFVGDLNRDNPLGTGGELAKEFADLLGQMWGTKNKRADTNGAVSSGHLYASKYSNGYYSGGTVGYDSSVIYPRDFKYTLGRHAEQFIGYDQHDSQELATYLLDALHEDTNRVTKKPYFEKPEQGENESDDEAAEKSWSLHLQRENSRVLESFMGQVKSRVQCPRENCGRVSTTFDPFMYLSVPIPGATDRTMMITYVPLDPSERMRKLNITINKTSTISALQKKIVDALMEQPHFDRQNDSEEIHTEDIAIVDVWNHEVHQFYKPEDEIDRIHDTDSPYAFHLRSVPSIHDEEAKSEDPSSGTDSDSDSDSRLTFSRQKKAKLDLSTITKLNRDEEWKTALEDYMAQPAKMYSLGNPKRSSHEERMEFYKKTLRFIEQCHKCSDAQISGTEDFASHTSDCDGDSEEDDHFEEHVDHSTYTLAERSSLSSSYRNVKSPQDLAVLEFCCRKFYQFTMRLEKEKKEKLKDGVVVQVLLKRPSPLSLASSSSFHTSSSISFGRSYATPFLLRISPRLTVYELRTVLAHRLSRACKDEQQGPNDAEKPSLANTLSNTNLDSEDGDDLLSTNEPVKNEELVVTSSGCVNVAPEEKAVETSSGFSPKQECLKPPTISLLQRVPLTYDRKSAYTYSRSSSYRRLGSLAQPDEQSLKSREIPFADPKDEGEEDLVANLVGHYGCVQLHWPQGLSEDYFDLAEWETVDEMVSSEEQERLKRANTSKKQTVLDCISKYCSMEQLEDSEKWYCNRCKDHVRAWKQFHLYRTPPILIVHLKRFQYSSTTHRRDKIDTFIDFPLTGLDLTGEVMHWKEGEEPIYDCYAVSNHYGGLGGGHYTAYALSDEGVWSHFDDSRVTTGVSEKEVCSSAAYVLYYRRRDVAVGFDQNISQKTDEVVTDDGECGGCTSSGSCSPQVGSTDGEDMSTEEDSLLAGIEDGVNPQAQ